MKAHFAVFIDHGDGVRGAERIVDGYVLCENGIDVSRWSDRAAIPTDVIGLRF